MNPSHILGPLALVALGALLLINNLVAEIPFRTLARDFWPLALIVGGFAQLAGAATAPFGRMWGRLYGGVFMITLGVLFLISRHTRFDFHETWPVLLVVAGGLGLLRVMGPGRMFPGGSLR